MDDSREPWPGSSADGSTRGLRGHFTWGPWVAGATTVLEVLREVRVTVVCEVRPGGGPAWSAWW